jgi:hypothetical protein
VEVVNLTHGRSSFARSSPARPSELESSPRRLLLVMSGPLARTAAPPTAGGPSRTLRKRASPPPPNPSPTQHASSSTSRSPVASHSDAPLRKPSEKELANVHRRLGAEGVTARRAELVSEKEGQLKGVVEGHDAAVREKFHLERFVTLLEGWDPEVRPGSTL